MFMSDNKDILLARIRSGQTIDIRQQVMLTILLSGPVIMAQLASVLLQFTDASMVGSLGARPSASIGLVSTTTWIFSGFCIATGQGFSVQVAHLIGSGDFRSARKVLRQGLSSVLIFSILLSLIGIAMANPLPGLLGGSHDINQDASSYLRIYTAFLPMLQLCSFGGGMLQCSGNMKIPSLLNTLMLMMNVAFNFLLIFETREICVGDFSFTMPGAGLGVTGAAIGTGIAQTITAFLMLYFLLVKSPELGITREKGSFTPTGQCLRNAFGISGPLWLQNIIMRGAYIASTVIVAPLGAISIAANSLAITAESFCYMPGYGMADAATTLVGQSLGAGRRELAKSFSRITLYLGVGMMCALAVVMYILAPQIMSLLSPDADVVALGAKVLRIEAFAEAGYAAAIVAYGSFVGAGDTLVPSALNLASMWVVRIGLAVILTPMFGLTGYWVAMCIELNVRGLLFLWRIRGTKWMKYKNYERD